MGLTFERKRETAKFRHTLCKSSVAGLVPYANPNFQAAKAPVDALHILEKVTAAMTSAIASESSAQSSGGVYVVSVGDGQISVSLPARHITLSELQRRKRQFVTVHKKAITLGTTEKGAVDWSEENIAQKFAQYLEEHLYS